jgi:hypothetical protein
MGVKGSEEWRIVEESKSSGVQDGGWFGAAIVRGTERNGE